MLMYMWVARQILEGVNKSQHKHSCNTGKHRCYNQKIYQYIRDNGGWDNWNMIEIEKYPCNDKREAEAREVYWQSDFNAKLNAIRAYRTEEQQQEYNKVYREKKRDYIKEHQKEYYKKYYENYKEKIKCDCGCVIFKHNLKKHLKTKKPTNF
jgi:hypothetical protein